MASGTVCSQSDNRIVGDSLIPDAVEEFRFIVIMPDIDGSQFYPSVFHFFPEENARYACCPKGVIEVARCLNIRSSLIKGCGLGFESLFVFGCSLEWVEIRK